MDANRFDRLTRALGASGSRRGALAALLAGVTGALFGAEAAAKRGRDQGKGKDHDRGKDAAKGRGEQRRRQQGKPDLAAAKSPKKKKKKCPPGKTKCGNACVNIKTSAAHCGKCNRPCKTQVGATAVCQNGLCQCAGGIVCGNTCVDSGQCCVTADCPVEPCHDVACLRNECSYNALPQVDGTPCQGGVCCDGACQVGSDTCGSDCTAGTTPCGDECCRPDEEICCGVFCYSGDCCDDADCVDPAKPICSDRHNCEPCTTDQQCSAAGKGARCCNGECISNTQCCNAGQHCGDRFCQEAFCEAHECVYRPDESTDGRGCPGGVCCNGNCIAGGNCCVPEDCQNVCQTEPECILPQHVCEIQELPDGTPCPGGACCDGQCLTDAQCCRTNQCEERACNDVACVANECVYTPDDGDDGDACPGGVCCGGVCCEQGQVCNPAGACCTPLQFPACPGASCGTFVSDGCGTVQECLCGPLQQGQTCCNGACIDTSADPDHCGSCERVCPRIPGDDQQESCVDGECTCTPQCQGKVCGPDGCDGTCGVCPADSVCNAGGTACICEFEDCGICCAQGQVCRTGPSTPGDVCCTPVGAECTPGLCIPPAPDECGGTVQCPCEDGLTCCNGVCVDTNTDAAHCGACEEECSLIPCGDQHETCVEGECIPCGCGDLDGVCFLRKWGSQNTTDGNFWGPKAIAVAPNGDVYTADPGMHRAQYFACDGTFKGKWGKAGSLLGQFSVPSGIAVAPNGDIYVADTVNKRIQHFEAPLGIPKSTPTHVWGTARPNDKPTTYPRSVAVAPNGDVYVGESGGNDRIQHFSATGAYKGQWGTQGGALGQFVDPFGISVAPNGDVYVADTSMHRIQYFSPPAPGLTPSNPPTGSFGGIGNTPGKLAAPYDVAVGPDGTVFVADTSNNRIQAFNPTGTSLLTRWGTPGILPKQFELPMGVAVAPDGTVYVMEYHGYRVQAFCVNLP